MLANNTLPGQRIFIDDETNDSTRRLGLQRR